MPTTYGKLIRNGVNFSHDTAESISYDNTTSGLSATDIQSALDEIASGAGGHNIKNDAGTTLTQRSNLKFKGTYAHDDSTNGDTVIENIREMTEQQYGQLSDAEKKGIILTDTEHDTPVFLNGNMVVYDENNTVTQAINSAKTATGTAYDNENSVKDMIDDIMTRNVKCLEMLIWDYTAKEFTFNAGWPCFLYGARGDKAICLIMPVNNNELKIISNDFGGTITHTSVNNYTHTLSFSAATSAVGTNINICVIGIA